jgi:hypothetical protein
MEHRAGIEPANTGFADQRVSHFTTGALGKTMKTKNPLGQLAAGGFHGYAKLS